MRRVHPEIQTRSRELRQPLTPAEQQLWACLRNYQLNGLKFRRQHPIGHFIVDFYCAQINLVIEVDGESHANQVEYDLARTEWLKSQGCMVLRFSNRQVQNELYAVLTCILDVCRQLMEKSNLI